MQNATDEEPSACAEAADETLKASILEILRGPIVRPQIPQSRPTVRRWLPNGVDRGARFIDRHPLFDRLPDRVPARQIARLSRSAGAGWSGYFQSLKLGRPVRHLSGIELDVFKACEADGSIEFFCEHPVTVEYGDRKKAKRKRLSVYYEREGIGCFVGCQWEATAARPGVADKWARVGEALAGMGFTLEVVTERHVRALPRAENIRSVLRGRQTEWPSQAVIRAIEAHVADAPTSIADLSGLFGFDEMQLFRLVMAGRLIVSLDVPDVRLARLRLPERIVSEPEDTP